jgi:hypothetical protein
MMLQAPSSLPFYMVSSLAHVSSAFIPSYLFIHCWSDAWGSTAMYGSLAANDSEIGARMGICFAFNGK